MHLQRLEFIQKLPIAPRIAWDYFSNPANLAAITPPWLGFEVMSPLPPEMYQGMIVSYRVRPFAGIPFRWVTEITHLRRPEFFVDEQRFGPYRFWHHQHHFQSCPGGVAMIDLVHYLLPCGPLGALLHGLLVRSRLEEIFSYRQVVLRRLFGELS